jgi:hypothetical protein
MTKTRLNPRPFKSLNFQLSGCSETKHLKHFRGFVYRGFQGVIGVHYRRKW